MRSAEFCFWVVFFLNFGHYEETQSCLWPSENAEETEGPGVHSHLFPPGEKMHFRNQPWNGQRLALTDVEEGRTQRFTPLLENTFFFPHCEQFSISCDILWWVHLTKLPPTRQNDKFLSLSYTPCQIELLFMVFIFFAPIMILVLYISDALDLAWLGSDAELTTGRISAVATRFLSLVCEKKKSLWVRGKQLFVCIHTKRNRFYCLHPNVQYVPWWHHPSSSCLSSPVRRAPTRTCSTFTKKQRLLLGLVFDDMPSECLISQCFDLLQLLDRSLVRAWIWHALPTITWRALYSVFPLLFLLPLFSFWNDILYGGVTLLLWLLYTHEKTLESGICWMNTTKQNNVLHLATRGWILLTCFHLSVFFLHCLFDSNTLDLPLMLRNLFFKHESCTNSM